MGKGAHIRVEQVAGKWGPPPPETLTEKELKWMRDRQALLSLIMDARYYLGGKLLFGLTRQQWLPLLSSREDFERARAEFPKKSMMPSLFVAKALCCAAWPLR